MTQHDRYEQVIRHFEAAMPDAGPELHYGSAFQLLVAVMLSAQCTDKRVNQVTPALFAAYPDAAALAQATPTEVLHYISSVSYPNSKSSHLVAMAQQLMEQHEGEVPSEAEALEALPGVGRKTANVVRAVAFDEPAMPVDTHVFRVANRIGLTHNSKTPLQTERTLLRHIPTDKLTRAHHWLILHGRYVCTARTPHCANCGLCDCCAYFGQRVAHAARQQAKTTRSKTQ